MFVNTIFLSLTLFGLGEGGGQKVPPLALNVNNLFQY